MQAHDTGEPVFTRLMHGKAQARPSDREIGLLAKRQHGVVSRTQLTALGLGEDAIDSRLSAGRLFRLHRGVYAVGHPNVPREGRWLAATFSGGAGAALSHGSAAELWGIRRAGDRDRIDITLPRATRSPGTIRRHEVPLGADEVTKRHRIPVTSLVRTLLDIAVGSSQEGLEGAIREAEYRHQFRIENLEALLQRHPGRRGAANIKACLQRLGRGPRGRTRSGFEVRFAALLARTDLPMPTLNTVLDLDGFKIEADCLWRKHRLIVELDGGESHRTRAAFETDRERDRRLQATGWRVVRVTWRQLNAPASLLNDLRRLLIDEPAVTRHIHGE
jgi:Transcriptional regulator, AbiEi antitoxin/Protein of unknown function (DUF559)